MSKRGFTVHFAVCVEGDGAAEGDQLMMDCSEQQMALYEVCIWRATLDVISK